MTPWDRGDPRLDPKLMQCIRDALDSVDLTALKEQMRVAQRERNRIVDAGGDTSAIDAKISKLRSDMDDVLNKEIKNPLEACNKSEEFESNLWNASSWSLGAAPYWTSENGSVGKLGNAGVSLWTSAAYGFDGVQWALLRRHAQMIFHLRYMVNQSVPDPDDDKKLIGQNLFLAGARARIGTNRFNFNAEAAWVLEDPKGQKSDGSVRYSVGADIRLVRKLWLTVSVGSEGGNSEKNESYVLGNIKYAIGDEPSIKVGE